MKIKELKSICLKGDKEPFIMSNLERPVSIRLTWLFVKLKLSSNFVTLLSFISVVIGCFLLSFKSSMIYSWSIIFLYLYEILDCSDGEVARYNIKIRGVKPGKDGLYLDWLVHAYSGNVFIFFIGYNCFLQFNNPLFIILGFIGCINSSNFHNLILAGVLVKILRNENETYINKPSIKELIEKITDIENDNSVLKNGSIKRKIFVMIKELLIFPGNLYIMMAIILFDSLLYLDKIFINMKGIFILMSSLYLSVNVILHIVKYKRLFLKAID